MSSKRAEDAELLNAVERERDQGHSHMLLKHLTVWPKECGIEVDEDVTFGAILV